MISYEENGIRIIEADDGAFVTNGEVYSDKVFLGKNASESAWRDATAEEKEKAEWDSQHSEPLTDEEALTRYANSITGADDPDLISAAETLITEKIKEDSK